MNTQALIDYCLTKHAATLATPFGSEPICVKIGGRIFAEVFVTRPWVTLKCDAAYGLALRAQYPEQIRRGYHCPTCQQPYNNTVTLDGVISDELLCHMIDHSYDHALCSLTMREQAALSEN